MIVYGLDIERDEPTPDDLGRWDRDPDAADLCIGCGYWVPTIGALCECCALEDAGTEPL